MYKKKSGVGKRVKKKNEEGADNNKSSAKSCCAVPAALVVCPTPRLDTSDLDQYVKVECTNPACNQSTWMHPDCFSKFEEKAISVLSKVGRARSWNDQTCRSAVWKNGFDLVVKSKVGVCNCGNGSLRKDLDYELFKDQVEPRREEKKKKKENKKPELNNKPVGVRPSQSPAPVKTNQTSAPRSDNGTANVKAKKTSPVGDQEDTLPRNIPGLVYKEEDAMALDAKRAIDKNREDMFPIEEDEDDEYDDLDDDPDWNIVVPKRHRKLTESSMEEVSEDHHHQHRGATSSKRPGMIPQKPPRLMQPVRRKSSGRDSCRGDTPVPVQTSILSRAPTPLMSLQLAPTPLLSRASTKGSAGARPVSDCCCDTDPMLCTLACQEGRPCLPPSSASFSSNPSPVKMSQLVKQPKLQFPSNAVQVPVQYQPNPMQLQMYMPSNTAQPVQPLGYRSITPSVKLSSLVAEVPIKLSPDSDKSLFSKACLEDVGEIYFSASNSDDNSDADPSVASESFPSSQSLPTMDSPSPVEGVLPSRSSLDSNSRQSSSEEAAPLQQLMQINQLDKEGSKDLSEESGENDFGQLTEYTRRFEEQFKSEIKNMSQEQRTLAEMTAGHVLNSRCEAESLDNGNGREAWRDQSGYIHCQFCKSFKFRWSDDFVQHCRTTMHKNSVRRHQEARERTASFSGEFNSEPESIPARKRGYTCPTDAESRPLPTVQGANSSSNGDLSFRKPDGAAAETDVLDLGKPEFRADILNEIKSEVQADLMKKMKGEVETDLSRKIETEVKNDLVGRIKSEIAADILGNIKDEMEADIRVNIKREMEADIMGKIKSQMEADVIEKIKREMEVELTGRIKSEMAADITAKIKSEMAADLERKTEKDANLIEEMKSKFETDILAIKSDFEADLMAKLWNYLDNEINRVKNELANISLDSSTVNMEAFKEKYESEVLNLKEAVNVVSKFIDNNRPLISGQGDVIEGGVVQLKKELVDAQQEINMLRETVLLLLDVWEKFESSTANKIQDAVKEELDNAKKAMKALQIEVKDLRKSLSDQQTLYRLDKARVSNRLSELRQQSLHALPSVVTHTGEIAMSISQQNCGPSTFNQHGPVSYPQQAVNEQQFVLAPVHVVSPMSGNPAPSLVAQPPPQYAYYQTMQNGQM